MTRRTTSIQPGATVVLRNRFSEIERTTTVAVVLDRGRFLDVDGIYCSPETHEISMRAPVSVETSAAQLLDLCRAAQHQTTDLSTT